MLRTYTLTRLAQGIVVLFGAVAISFVLTNVIGTPADVLGGPDFTAEQRQALNASLGYDQPATTRFIHYLAGLATGDLGPSYRTNTSALGEVLAALPNTVILGATAWLICAAIAIPLAVFSARRRETRPDRVLRRTIGVLQGMPEFWFALMLILIFSVQLAILPSFGFHGPTSLALPAVALAIPMVPTLFRIFRGQILDVLGEDFIEAMRARGLPERVIMSHHVLPNTAGPTSTLIALQLGHLISGSIVVETIFSWPGIGNLTISAVQARDFTVVQAIIIVVAAFYVLLNLAADLIVVATDPRVRVGTP